MRFYAGDEMCVRVRSTRRALKLPTERSAARRNARLFPETQPPQLKALALSLSLSLALSLSLSPDDSMGGGEGWGRGVGLVRWGWG